MAAASSLCPPSSVSPSVMARAPDRRDPPRRKPPSRERRRSQPRTLRLLLPLRRDRSRRLLFSSPHKFTRDRFQEMCKILRVLNTVRNYEIGIPLSIQQYKALTFLMEVVIMHWACAKITTSSAIQDSSLLEILLDKIKLCKGISYAAIATHVDNSGRRKLAAMIVDHEPCSSKQSQKQTGNEECGYYVMRHMLNIVSAKIVDSWDKIFTNKDPFSEDEIDEVKRCWTTYLLEIVNTKV